MKENLIKITIKGASGWCPCDLAYSDKLTIKQDGITYERKPVEENENNPYVKWSYKTNSAKYKDVFHMLGEQIPQFQDIEDMFVTDVTPNQIKFFFEDKVLTFDTYFYDGVEKFVELVRLMIPETEDIPYCLHCAADDDEDDEC